jgi:microcystin-dependent protein
MVRRGAFLWSGAGALLAGCAGGLAAPNPGDSEKLGLMAREPLTFAYLGEILLVPYDYVPAGWALCDGSALPIKDFVSLFALLGTRFGGNGNSTFGLPDLRGHEPLKGLKYIIALYGDSPWNDSSSLRYYGELSLVPYDLTPRGWAQCDGSLLAIDKNVALFTLLGTQFGGDGQKTFALPDTRGHEPAKGLKYLISLSGTWPSRASSRRDERPQTNVYVGELLLVPYYTPAGWLPCDGQLVEIGNNSALYTLVGDKFGGNAKSTFGLPDMRKHVPVEFLKYVIATPGYFPPRP